MTYRIKGLEAATFRPLFGLSDEELARQGVRRVAVTERPGAPCRLSLDDAKVGEQMLLLNHQSVPSGPYRATHAIYVTEGLEEAAEYVGSIPPALDRRVLSLRAFDPKFDMLHAELVQPGAADEAVRRLLAEPEIAFIHAHYATRGCFAAVVERS